VADFSYPFGLRKHFSSELRRYCHAVGFETVANAIPAMQFAISQADSIHRSPWFFEYPFNYNLDNICVDGRLFERLTARSAVGGRLDRIDKKFDLKVESAQRTRVVLLTNAPAPYRVAFLQHLSRLCDLTVLFDTLSEPNRRWVLNIKDFEFRYKLLKGLSISYVRQRDNSRDQRFMHFRYDILNQLASLRPNVVVSGEMGSRSLQAALYCRLTKTPLIVASEGTLHTERGITKLKIWVRKRLIRRTSRLWSNGRDTTALLESYGADPAKIDAGMTGIDTKTLFIRVNNLLSNRTQIRDELAVDGTVFLFVGQFVERKGILQYLKALDVASRHSRGKWSALFVGSGNRESDLRKWAYDHPEIRVAITGFVQQTELPRYFAAADVFVLPTLDDNWPLASLEALAAGVPQLFSEYNGGTADLLVRGTIGKRINPERTDEFAAAIKEWIETPPHRLSSDDVAEIVEYYSPAALAQRAIISIEKAIQASV